MWKVELIYRLHSFWLILVAKFPFSFTRSLSSTSKSLDIFFLYLNPRISEVCLPWKQMPVRIDPDQRYPQLFHAKGKVQLLYGRTRYTHPPVIPLMSGPPLHEIDLLSISH